MCPDSLCCPQLKVWIIKVMNTFPLAAESLINPNTGCHRPIVTPRVGGPTKITSEKNSLIRLIKQVVPNGEFFSSSGQRIRHERDVLGGKMPTGEVSNLHESKYYLPLRLLT